MLGLAALGLIPAPWPPPLPDTEWSTSQTDPPPALVLARLAFCGPASSEVSALSLSPPSPMSV